MIYKQATKTFTSQNAVFLKLCGILASLPEIWYQVSYYSNRK
jgi:hypothetical protein